MKTKSTISLIVLMITLTLSIESSAKTNVTGKNGSVDAYQLSYIEREPGTDEYEVTMIVSDRYIRIDETDEDSGYIIYDDKDSVIYSVSHHDDSVLVIKKHQFSVKDSPVKANIEYLQLADAPSVSGENIYNYRVYIGDDADEGETCIELQIVENILPKVRQVLQNYKKVVSGQQVKMVDNKITEMQSACFYIDQIYDEGAYYDKGLPVQEWHSNESSRLLTSYKKISAEEKVFDIPKQYRKFSIDSETKFLLQ